MSNQGCHEDVSESTWLNTPNLDTDSLVGIHLDTPGAPPSNGDSGSVEVDAASARMGR